MKDEKHEFDYLLDDDEFARAMNYRYVKDGKPRDHLAEQRIWKRLALRLGRGKSRWIYPLSILAAVALLLIFVRPSVQNEPEPRVKTAIENVGLSVEWIDGPNESGMKVRSLQPRFVVIYASDDKGQRQRVHEPFKLEAEEERIVPVSLDPAQTWRVCALTAESAVELERLEAMLDLVWTQMSEQQCVTR